MNKITVSLGILLVVFLAGIGLWWVTAEKMPTLGNNTSDRREEESSSPAVKRVNSQEFGQLLEEEKAFVIDVHTPQQTHIPGTDAFIPFDQIQNNLSKLPQDKTTPILVYCRSGGMSSQASQEIAQLGYTNVYDLEGGTNAFKEQNVSVELWPQKQDLGTVIYGYVATTDFTLTNYSPLPMKVTRVSTSCGCTKATIEKEELGAYESTTVKVSFDPAVHKDDTDLGELSRTIYIETDSPNFSEIEAQITANVIKKK